MMEAMKDLVITTPSRTVEMPLREDARARAVVTGETDQTLKVFTEIHRSKRFTATAAHLAFAGVKRKK